MIVRSCPPVLFLIFNRPDLTQSVFDRIQEARPNQLFVAADGPRQNQPIDYKLCQDARKVATEVVWPCELKTLFREKNLGCGKAVSEAITWFFEHVGEGIILEDDCLPHPTFFRFCDELLERYRNERRVKVIKGDNYHTQNWSIKQSYYFSIYHGSWGWATWRRAWQYYDKELSQWPRLRNTSWLADLLDDSKSALVWKNIFDKVHAGQIDTWDFQWVYSCWREGGFSVVPSVNMITNMGHSDKATHTNNHDDALADLPSLPMEFPLRHPSFIVRDFPADRDESRYFSNIQFNQAKNWSTRARSILRIGYQWLPYRILRVIDRMRSQSKA
jgi:hypothetical protein